MSDIDFAANAEVIARALLGDPTETRPNELRFRTHGSLVVNIQKGVFKDFEDNGKGGMLTLIMRERKCSKPGAIAWIKETLGLSSPKPNGKAKDRKEVASYKYVDEAGILLYEVVRFEPKDFSQRRPDGNGGWDWKLGDVRRVLYRLPELISAVSVGNVIFLVEGEKDAENLHKLNICATTCAMGANKWRPEYNDNFRDADVVIVPHNDGPGRKHTQTIAAQLYPVAKRIRILELPGLAAKGDVSDWIAADGTAEKLKVLTEVVTAYAPASGIEMLNAVYQFLGRFVAYPDDHARVAHALWCVHAHLMHLWDATPRIAFLSPEPASGKSRALEITNLFVPNPVVAVNMSPSYLFRKVGGQSDDDSGPVTLLHDEIDTVFGPKRMRKSAGC